MIHARVYATVPMLEESELTIQDHGVWLSLCSFAKWKWENGKPVVSLSESCFPTMKMVASRLNCSVDTVKRSVKRLEALGHVSREHHFRPDGGQTANYYTLKA